MSKLTTNCGHPTLHFLRYCKALMVNEFMATISSHVLDSVSGDHANGIKVQCYQVNSPTERTLLFDETASAEGRISEEVDVSDSSTVELVFQAAEYFAGIGAPDSGVQIMPEVVARLSLPDATAKYHIPIMLSPHSYSIWWSGF